MSFVSIIPYKYICTLLAYQYFDPIYIDIYTGLSLVGIFLARRYRSGEVSAALLQSYKGGFRTGASPETPRIGYSVRLVLLCQPHCIPISNDGGKQHTINDGVRGGSLEASCLLNLISSLFFNLIF